MSKVLKILEAKWPTVKAIDYKDKIISKKVTPAGLYEPDQAPPGTKFIYIDFGPAVGKKFYRIRESINEKYVGDLDGEKAYYNPSPMELEACLNSTEWQFVRYIVHSDEIYIATGDNYEHQQMARTLGIDMESSEEHGSIWFEYGELYYSKYNGYNLESNRYWMNMTRKLRPTLKND